MSAGKLVTKAAVATAVVGGGALLLADAAGAETAPVTAAAPAPSPFLQLQEQLLGPYAPQFLQVQQAVTGTLAQWASPLKPAADPNTAQAEATPTHASGTAWRSGEDDQFLLGRSEATPETAKVTLVRAFGHDLLTKEGDEDGGHYGGEWKQLGETIDWANEQTCPSGVHGGAEMCFTFLDSSATTKTTEEGKDVSKPVELRPLVENALPSGIKNSNNAIFKGLINGFLTDLDDTELVAHGTSQGTSTQADASFDLFKFSYGGDSFSLLPTSATSSSIEFAPGLMHTDATTLPLTALKTSISNTKFSNNAGTNAVIKGIVLALVPNSIPIPAGEFQYPGSPRECASGATANVVTGTGVFSEGAAFFDHPESANDSDVCEETGPIITAA